MVGKPRILKTCLVERHRPASTLPLMPSGLPPGRGHGDYFLRSVRLCVCLSVRSLVRLSARRAVCLFACLFVLFEEREGRGVKGAGGRGTREREKCLWCRGCVYAWFCTQYVCCGTAFFLSFSLFFPFFPFLSLMLAVYFSSNAYHLIVDSKGNGIPPTPSRYHVELKSIG